MITSSTTTTKIATRGYLFDIYHIKDKAILWIKEEENDGSGLNGNPRCEILVYPVSDSSSTSKAPYNPP